MLRKKSAVITNATETVTLLLNIKKTIAATFFSFVL